MNAAYYILKLIYFACVAWAAYDFGYSRGRKTGVAEGWLERDEQAKRKESSRHDREGKFTSKRRLAL